MEAHVAGMPIEEVALSVAPPALVFGAALAARMRRSWQWPWTWGGRPR